jgi:hypothetical protein
MIMVAAVCQFEYGMAAIEIMPNHEASRLELGQHAVNGRQTDILAGLHQRLVDVLGTHMAPIGGIQHLQDLDPWQGYFEASFA